MEDWIYRNGWIERVPGWIGYVLTVWVVPIIIEHSKSPPLIISLLFTSFFVFLVSLMIMLDGLVLKHSRAIGALVVFLAVWITPAAMYADIPMTSQFSIMVTSVLAGVWGVFAIFATDGLLDGR